MRALRHILLGLSLLPIALAAQTTHPASVDHRHDSDVVGLILGRTTLTEVERIFAERGQREALASVRVPRHLTPAPKWTLGGAVITPSIKVDQTRESPTLYFDASKRLVLVVDSAARGSLSRAEFQSQHPRATVTGRFRGTVALEAPLEQCVTISGLFDDRGGLLQQLAYGYTCRLK